MQPRCARCWYICTYSIGEQLHVRRMRRLVRAFTARIRNVRMSLNTLAKYNMIRHVAALDLSVNVRMRAMYHDLLTLYLGIANIINH